MHFGVGWIKYTYTSATGVTEQPVNATPTGVRGTVGMTTETQTLCEPCLLIQFKMLLVFHGYQGPPHLEEVGKYL